MFITMVFLKIYIYQIRMIGEKPEKDNQLGGGKVRLIRNGNTSKPLYNALFFKMCRYWSMNSWIAMS